MMMTKKNHLRFMKKIVIIVRIILKKKLEIIYQILQKKYKKKILLV